MSTPRTPRYFPRMKVRGARRRRIAPLQRIAGAFDRLQVDTEKAVIALTGLASLVTLQREEEAA